MYDIKILEEEWKRYNRKKRLPWILGSIAFVLIAVSFIFLSDLRTLISSLQEQEKQVHKKSTKYENILISGPLIMLEDKNEADEKNLPLVDVSLETTQEKNSENLSRKSVQIEVVEANDPNAYKEVEKRFRLGHDVDDSLFLAKAYYAKRKYKKAEYWALQTNKIDNNIEESWLIFVKAKLKRGQKNEALRILNAYIKRTNSAEAKVLLEKIKTGKV